jgi:hypothetical protein
MRATMTALTLLLTALPAHANPPLKRARVVIICDSNCGPTPSLNACARAGGRLMYELFGRKMPASQRTITFLDGKQVTPKQILATIKGLPVRPDESLFVYSIGHGVYVKGTGYVFNYSGGPLPRAQLLAAMKAKRAGLTILYSECCADYASPRARGANVGGLLEGPHPRAGSALSDLLLRDRGVVDITAAKPGTSAVARADLGGNLTAALFLLTTELKKSELDADKDGRVTWREMWPNICEAVAILYKAAPLKGQPKQEPVQFGLGGGKKTGPMRVTRGGEDSN